VAITDGPVGEGAAGVVGVPREGVEGLDVWPVPSAAPLSAASRPNAALKALFSISDGGGASGLRVGRAAGFGETGSGGGAVTCEAGSVTPRCVASRWNAVRKPAVSLVSVEGLPGLGSSAGDRGGAAEGVVSALAGGLAAAGFCAPAESEIPFCVARRSNAALTTSVSISTDFGVVGDLVGGSTFFAAGSGAVAGSSGVGSIARFVSSRSNSARIAAMSGPAGCFGGSLGVGACGGGAWAAGRDAESGAGWGVLPSRSLRSRSNSALIRAFSSSETWLRGEVGCGLPTDAGAADGGWIP
jgi:hypothetical protein